VSTCAALAADEERASTARLLVLAETSSLEQVAGLAEVTASNETQQRSVSRPESRSAFRDAALAHQRTSTQRN
jgi:hypothetical protein